MKLIIFIVLMALGVAVILSLVQPARREPIFIMARLIQASTTTHADRNNRETIGLTELLKEFVLILVFMALFGCLIVLVGFEILAVWSCGTLNYDPAYPFFSVTGFGSNFLTVLIFF